MGENDYIVNEKDYLHVDHNHELMVSPLNRGIEYMRERVIDLLILAVKVLHLHIIRR